MSGLDILNNVFKKVFGSRNERLLKQYRRVAEHIETFEPQLITLDDDGLRARSDQLRDRLRDGESEEQVLPEAFAVLREASRRAQNHRHFHCQLIGGQVLFEGKIAEMRTGEGKTIVCHLASYLKVLQGYKVHIVTVNDYLVRRDAEFAQPIFEMLGMSVGYIQSNVDPGGAEGVRRKAYACDITYGTNNEFGFDYLRDNMKIRLEDQVQGRLDYVIIDEVDSILIDEARTPLIISGPAHDDVTRYKWADQIARHLQQLQQQAAGETARRIAEWKEQPPQGVRENPRYEDAMRRFKLDPNMLSEEEAQAIGHRQHYVVQLDRKAVQITHEGVEAAQIAAGIGSFYVGANMDRPHLIEQSLRARVVYEKDKDYVVQNGEVIIVDEFTGRLMYGRQWSDGLHQAVEAKEGVKVKEESQTLATITIQNYFKIYKSLAGMTGTAITESDEFMKVYNLEVVEIPTNRPVNRVDHIDMIYNAIGTKYSALVEEINEYHKKGRSGDPLVLLKVVKALRDVPNLPEGSSEKIEKALEDYNNESTEEHIVAQSMMQAYDAAMNNLVRGRPVLVGTTSVENSEKLSELLSRRYGIEHEVLNAKQHAREADIVTKAGQTHVCEHGDQGDRGNVTIATNMAGRGTDIKLSLNVVYENCKVHREEDASPLYPTGVTKCCIHCAEYDPATNCSHCFKPKLDSRFPALGRKVCNLNAPCGLHIVGTERHEARRIDNQLRGRSGRQGDPGSSRFFLSLEDDLLKLFMADWMLKMIEKNAMIGGHRLEDKRFSKAVERAQKKVEERNFSSRKNLLEWDEPLNYQRNAFYRERQQILQGKQIIPIIWQMISESVREATLRYLSSEYPAKCISEWCRSSLEVVIDPSRIKTDDPHTLEDQIRRHAISEARESIQTSLGEYIDVEAAASEWDLAGLVRWAERSFKANISQNQLRKMSRDEIENWLIERAEQHFESVDLGGIDIYLEPNLGRMGLVEWAKNKFAIELSASDIQDATADQTHELILERARESYHQREISYPIEYIMARAYGEGSGDSAYAAQLVANWVNSKYRLDWTMESVQEKEPSQIYGELLEINRNYWSNGHLAEEIDQAMAEHSGSELLTWAQKRFGSAYQEDLLTDDNGDVEEVLEQMGQEMLRFELTQLERFVLLRIYDQAWKDHLLEMDQLKSAIQQRPIGGDQTHPQSQFALEGRELFNQMWDRIQEHVTDRIFKVRLIGDVQTQASADSRMQLRHDESSGTGFAGAAADQAAAMRAQDQQQVVETIRREQPKVGRNDPCPCGSGKKYKQCHGKQ